MTISIAGFTDSFKVPVFAGKLVLGAGALSSGAGAFRCLLAGHANDSGGTIVPDVDVLGPLTSQDEVDAAAGAGSELSIMAEAAFAQNPSVKLYIAATTPPSGGTKATVTLAITGSVPSTSGEIALRIKGVRLAVAIPTGQAIDTFGAAIAAKVNAAVRCPFTAAYDSGTDTVTLTQRHKGVRGKLWEVFLDQSLAPTGPIWTLTGSGTVTGGGVNAGASSTGTGSDDVTTILTKLQATRWARIAAAANDATNAALWEAYAVAKQNPLNFQLEQINFGQNGSSGTATTLASSTLNTTVASVYAMRNSESHPSMIAAAMAAQRSVVEGGDAESGGWVPDYDGLVLPGIHAYEKTTEGDCWTQAEQDVLLNAGVTPIISVNGVTQVVRAICSYCLLGGTTPDDRVLDLGDVTFPENALYDLQSMYWNEVRPVNKYVGPNPAEGEDPPPAGVLIPDRWDDFVSARNQKWFDLGYIEDPKLNPPVSEYQKSTRRIMSVVPWVVRRVAHQIGVVGRQTAP